MKGAQTRDAGFRRFPPELAGLLVALALLFSCSPDSGFNTVRDYYVVATYYDPDADFASRATYAMPDTIIYFRGPDDTSSAEPPGGRDDLILDLIRTNLAALGYAEERDPGSSEPDVFVAVSVGLVDWLSTSTADWWDRWGWYPHWPISWGPAWGIRYPFPVECFYQAGSIFIDMVDEGEIEEGEEPYIWIVWTGTINGIMADTSADAEERLIESINQAFIQSSYLATR